MPKLKMTFEFTKEGFRHDIYDREIQISDDPAEGAAEWVHYIESFLNEIRMAILPYRGRINIGELLKRKVEGPNEG